MLAEGPKRFEGFGSLGPNKDVDGLEGSFIFKASKRPLLIPENDDLSSDVFSVFADVLNIFGPESGGIFAVSNILLDFYEQENMSPVFFY